jgi:hypothetical protein
MDDYAPLCQSLNGWFEKPFADLPQQLQTLVLSNYTDPPSGYPEELLYLYTPLYWDKLNPKVRREFAQQVDDLFDPKKKPVREYWSNLAKRKFNIEQEIIQWKKITVITASDLAVQKAQLEELNKKLADLCEEERQSLANGAPVAIVTNIDTPSAIFKNTCQPASAAEIQRRFRVLPDADKNATWWKGITREAKRNGLVKCRVGEGKPGPGGSLWRPELVAGWLADRHDKNHNGVASVKVGGMLKHFAGCEEAAENWFPGDEE